MWVRGHLHDRVDGDKAMTEPNANDRLLDNFRALVRAELESMGLQYVGVFGYTIKQVSGSPPNVQISAAPDDPSLGLPDLVNILEAPGVDGITTIPTAGIGCRVAFVDRDPTKPVIIGVNSLGVNPVARLGDQVTMFLPPTLAIQGVGSITGPFAGSITIANPVTGIISQGSGQVFTG